MTEAEVQRLMGLHDVAADDNADLARSIGTADQDYWVRKKIASRAALESALREALQPAGWRLVPDVPTKAMLHAGSAAADSFGTPLTRTGMAYRAMLVAAPTTAPAAPEVPADARERLHAAFRALGYTTNSQTRELLDIVFAAMAAPTPQEQKHD